MAANFGLANTNKFMLGVASVLIGNQADLFNLTQASNDLGLVKNFKLSTKPTFAELTQGVQNTVVYSVLNGHTANGSAELYEYTPQNLRMLAQTNQFTFTPATNIETTLSAAVTGSTGSPATTFTVVSGTGFAVNDWLIIEDPVNADDQLVRQIASIATNTITPSQNIQRNIANGSKVRRMNFVPIAQKIAPQFYSMLVTGSLADGSEITLALPKVRVTGGLDMSFMSNDYGNLPFEFEILDLTPADPNYTYFGAQPAAILV